MVTGTTLPRMCFVGPMLGGQHGRAPAQALTLARLFELDGARVFTTSGQPNRYVRFADISKTLLTRRRDMDVILLQVFSGRSFVVEDTASAIGRALGVPIVMILRGGNLPQFYARNPRWTKRVLSRAAAIVTPSHYLAHELSSIGLPLHVIPNTIDLGSYPFRSRRELSARLLWMRAFHEIYDPLLAVRAFAEVKLTHPHSTLTMAGPDLGLLSATRTEVNRLNLGSSVHFAGFLDDEAKRRAGMEHDIYLNTNRIDNMPVSVLEMAAMGLPIVATNVGGIPFLLRDGDNALLVRLDDPNALASAIARLLSNPTLAATLSTNGRRLAEGSAWERVKPQWIELLSQLHGVA